MPCVAGKKKESQETPADALLLGIGPIQHVQKPKTDPEEDYLNYKNMKFVFHMRRLEELDFFSLMIETARIYDRSLETEHILIILMRDKYQEQKRTL